ncbi:hypothetical protein BCON_0035g00400 [Botryotinia convoluta]|uniref:Uncharacterized protein n=1 Tax=Botryotinia convoluta TaxID=54673 RepID=A0A4Z1IIW6_9HELO|nr:hypothetical protein BCON_0035g00400 [Botryotinia convoluta]
MQYQVVALNLGKKRKKKEREREGEKYVRKSPFRENTIQKARSGEDEEAPSNERRATSNEHQHQYQHKNKF